MRKKGERKIGECVYCGKITPLTRDHVVPKNFFIAPFPINPVTVPCCEPCNNTKSKDDDYFRDWITSDIYASNHPVAQRIFEDKVVRSAQRGSSEFARTAAIAAKSEPFYTQGGVYIGSAVVIPINTSRVTLIFTRIVRGLYYDARHQRIPDNYRFEVGGYKPWDFIKVLDKLRQMHMNGPRRVGSVFGCAFLSAQEDPFTTFWLLWFYNGAFFSVSVENPDLLPKR